MGEDVRRALAALREALAALREALAALREALAALADPDVAASSARYWSLPAIR